MAKVRRKQVLSQVVHSEDGNLWWWDMAGLVWRWEPSGHTTSQNLDNGTARTALFTTKLETAVAYSLGYSDGQGRSEHAPQAAPDRN